MPKSRPTQLLVDLIRKQIVVTLPDMHAVLGPVSHRTVCRKLTQVGCRSSYSHRGRYYTLDELADFDAQGLWSYGDIHFSRNGTLKATLINLVERSYGGLFARDLKRMVKLDVLAALNKLIQTGCISRTKIDGHFLYVSKHADLPRHCWAFWMRSNGGCMLDWSRFVRIAVEIGKSLPDWGWRVPR